MARALCFAVLCGLAARASASPFDDPTAGRAVFTGATMPNATSIELNPAALGLTEIDELYFAAMAVVDRFAIDRLNLDVTSGALSPGSSVRDLEASPGGQFVWVSHIHDRGSFALGFRVSPAELFPANQDALRYHTLGGGQRNFVPTVAAQIRVANPVWFGLSLGGQVSTLRLRYARDTALESGMVNGDCGGRPCGIENPLATETYDVRVRTNYVALDNLVANIGLVVQLAPNAWFGIAYHTPPGLAVQTELSNGWMNVRRAPRDGGALVEGGEDSASVIISQPASADGELRLRLPDQLDVHVGMRWIDLSRFGAYDVRGYGPALAAAGIPEWTERPRGLHDPFAVWAGVEQIETGLSAMQLGARIGFETSSVRDDRTSPLTIAPSSLTVDVGMQFRLSDNIVLQGTYGFQYFPKVNVTESAFDPNARLSCIASGYDYSTAACESVRLGYGIPSADGDYSRMEHAFRLALRYEFH